MNIFSNLSSSNLYSNIFILILATLGTYHILTNILRTILGGENSDVTLTQLINQYAKEYGWVLRLTINCFRYSCIFLPRLLIYKYTKAVKDFDRSDSKSFIPATVRYCLLGGSDTLDYNLDGTSTSKLNAAQKSSLKECFLLGYCFCGLMGSYLTLGVLQEKIMTREYVDSEGKKSFFKDSQFLVFSNRELAFVISAIYLAAKHHIIQFFYLFKLILLLSYFSTRIFYLTVQYSHLARLLGNFLYIIQLLHLAPLFLQLS